MAKLIKSSGDHIFGGSSVKGTVFFSLSNMLLNQKLKM